MTPLRLPAVVLAVLALAGCGGSDDGAEQKTVRTNVDQILSDPGAWNSRPVQVRGQAYPSGSLGFVLVQDGRSLFVDTSGNVEVDPGSPVVVAGKVGRLADARSETLRDQLREPDLPDTQNAAPGALEDVPAEPGDPYLLFRGFVGG